MRVVLLHNPSAGGDSQHSIEELEDHIRRAGHQVVSSVDDPSEAEALLRRPGVTSRCDLVVVAGGDGTVSSMAGAVAAAGLPLAVIPVGTANNIALSLGLKGSPGELISSWDQCHFREMDLASATLASRPIHFFEAAGCGVFPQVMREADALPEEKNPAAKLERDLGVFQSVAETASVRPYTLTLDGVDASGRYLAVEIMNIPFIGPNIPLAPDGDPGDGLFEVVALTEEDRGDLRALIGDLRKQGRTDVRLRKRRARRILVSSDERHYHFDGHFHALPAVAPAPIDLHVEVNPRALRVLALR